jgi:hypothetical protein
MLEKCVYSFLVDGGIYVAVFRVRHMPVRYFILTIWSVYGSTLGEVLSGRLLSVGETGVDGTVLRMTSGVPMPVEKCER